MMAGFQGQEMEHVTGFEVDADRPLSMSWITDELLARTRRVWTKAYGRSVNETEAVEILLNVKQMAEVLIRAKQERNAQ